MLYNEPPKKCLGWEGGGWVPSKHVTLKAVEESREGRQQAW